jgi:hypothetical protein
MNSVNDYIHHAFAEELGLRIINDMKRMLVQLCEDMPPLKNDEVMSWFDAYTKNTILSDFSKVDPNIDIMDDSIHVGETVKHVRKEKKNMVMKNEESSSGKSATIRGDKETKNIVNVSITPNPPLNEFGVPTVVADAAVNQPAPSKGRKKKTTTATEGDVPTAGTEDVSVVADAAVNQPAPSKGRKKKTTTATEGDVPTTGTEDEKNTNNDTMCDSFYPYVGNK